MPEPVSYHLSFVLVALWCACHVRAITVYGQQGVMTMASGRNDFSTVTPDPTSVYDPSPTTYTGLAAFNPVVLAPPPLPSPLPPNQFPITAPNNAQNMPGLSFAHGGDFLGFSIEMSIADQVSEYQIFFCF